MLDHERDFLLSQTDRADKLVVEITRAIIHDDHPQIIIEKSAGELSSIATLIRLFIAKVA